MALLYLTRDGDMVDAICAKHYGRTAVATERVLEANPGLADFGPRLPAALTITLPDLPPPETRTVIRIWG
jgi:phage tail protein X